MTAYVPAAEREVQLLDAAKRVLVRDGYQGLTLRTVASEAGVRLSTLQYIFKTRADLLRELTRKVMNDCGFSRHRAGERGLETELLELVRWFGSEVLADPGMRELLRAEFIANASRREPSADDYPAGRPLLGHAIDPWLQRVAESGPEQFAVPVPVLADVITIGFAGLTYDFLYNDDLGQYQRIGQRLVAAAVALADPHPRPR